MANLLDDKKKKRMLEKRSLQNDLFSYEQKSLDKKIDAVLPWLLQLPNIKNFFQNNLPHLEANLSNQLRRQIQRGELSFMYSKDGNMLAVLKKNNKIYKQIPLKESNLQPAQAQILGMLGLQLQLQDIQHQLYEIKELLESLRQGQMNDRFACIISARRLLEEALLLPAEENKPLLMEAQGQISLGMAQIELDLRRELAYLMNSEAKSWGWILPEKSNKEVMQHAAYFCQDLTHLHQAAFLRAAIYFHMGKIPLMKKVLRNYMDELIKCFPEEVRLRLNSNIGNQPSVISAWNTKLKDVNRSFASLLAQVETADKKEELEND